MSKKDKYKVPPTHTYTPRSPGLNQKVQIFEDKSKRLPPKYVDYCDWCYELIEDCICDDTNQEYEDDEVEEPEERF